MVQIALYFYGDEQSSLQSSCSTVPTKRYKVNKTAFDGLFYGLDIS